MYFTNKNNGNDNPTRPPNTYTRNSNAHSRSMLDDVAPWRIWQMQMQRVSASMLSSSRRAQLEDAITLLTKTVCCRVGAFPRFFDAVDFKHNYADAILWSPLVIGGESNQIKWLSQSNLKRIFTLLERARKHLDRHNNWLMSVTWYLYLPAKHFFKRVYPFVWTKFAIYFRSSRWAGISYRFFV